MLHELAPVLDRHLELEVSRPDQYLKGARSGVLGRRPGVIGGARRGEKRREWDGQVPPWLGGGLGFFGRGGSVRSLTWRSIDAPRRLHMPSARMSASSLEVKRLMSAV